MLRIASLALILSSCFVSGAGAANAVEGDDRVVFERHVRPILKAHCFQCHGEAEELAGGLDLRLRRFIVKGGDSGPALAAGKPVDSLLHERVVAEEMPPGDMKLAPKQVALIERWIAQGAKTVGPEPEQIGSGLLITDDDRNFWAFRPIRRPEVPVVDRPELVRTPIDAFLLKRLHTEGLSFSPEADKRTLLRRAWFDLVGLPPTPEEVVRFLADEEPDAYERMIDRLLASPRYGERVGRHWLDVAGYADSEGYTESDSVRNYAYKYRDYVIRSCNDNQPFDEFVHEQLAGDEMTPPPVGDPTREQVEKLVATGYLRMAPDGTGAGGVDQTAARNQVVADTVQIVTTSLMGLTVGCAQCHHHRYDPIPHEDYHRIRAIFEPAYDWKNWRAPNARRFSLFREADRRRAAEIEADAAKIDAERTKKQKEYIQRTLEKELAKLSEEIRATVRKARETPGKDRTAEQKQLLKEHPSVNVSAGSLYLYDRKAADDLKRIAAQAAKVRTRKPVEDFVRALTEVPGKVPTTHLFDRGDPGQPKQPITPGGLTVLASFGSVDIAADDPSLPSTGRRLAFARRLTDGEHPLTARVFVNRVWLGHFGSGIVGTPGDFGALGERPAHPELLDWLAREFMESGWDRKRLHRLIMTSTAYRQSARRDERLDSIDPDNRLYGRMSVRRLQAEVLRDSILAVSGKLNLGLYGPPIPVKEDGVGQIVIGIENKNGENRPGAEIPLHGEEFRRSLYVQVRRSRPLAVLDAFDIPAMTPNCDARTSSTVTPQALLLLNSEFIAKQSGFIAKRVHHAVGSDARAQARLAWRLTFAKEASDVQLDEAVEFLAQQAERFRSQPTNSAKKPADRPDPRRQALASFCQALIASNEFLYVD